MPKKRTAPKPNEDTEILDALIKQYCRELLNSDHKNIKMGDFIKMAELKRKLKPVDADQAEFWRMLDKIREEGLGPQPAKVTKKSKRAKVQNEKS